MKVSKLSIIFLGLVTALYSISPVLFMINWSIGWFGLWGLIPFYNIFESVTDFVFFSSIFLGPLLMLIYAIHIIRNKAGAPAVRAFSFWGVLSFPFIAMPLYYYLYFWRDQPPAWAVIQASSSNLNKTFSLRTWLLLGGVFGLIFGLIISIFIATFPLEGDIDQAPQLVFSGVVVGVIAGMVCGAMIWLTRRAQFLIQRSMTKEPR